MEFNEQRGRVFSPGALAAGGILLAIGIALLVDPTGTVAIHPGRLIGPFIMIGLGASTLFTHGNCAAAHTANGRDARRHERGRSTAGLWLIGLGCWMLVSHTHLFGLTFATSWPLLLIFMGLLIAVRGVR